MQVSVGSQLMRSVTRIAGVITEMIKHTTHEQSLVVACHVNYAESDDSMARRTPSRCRDLVAAAQQELLLFLHIFLACLDSVYRETRDSNK